MLWLYVYVYKFGFGYSDLSKLWSHEHALIDIIHYSDFRVFDYLELEYLTWIMICKPCNLNNIYGCIECSFFSLKLFIIFCYIFLPRFLFNTKIKLWVFWRDETRWRRIHVLNHGFDGGLRLNTDSVAIILYNKKIIE